VKFIASWAQFVPNMARNRGHSQLAMVSAFRWKCSAAEQEDRTTREPAGLSLSPADSRVWRHSGVCIACRG
jgi:hypothetical protein